MHGADQLQPTGAAQLHIRIRQARFSTDISPCPQAGYVDVRHGCNSMEIARAIIVSSIGSVAIGYWGWSLELRGRVKAGSWRRRGTGLHRFRIRAVARHPWLVLAHL